MQQSMHQLHNQPTLIDAPSKIEQAKQGEHSVETHCTIDDYRENLEDASRIGKQKVEFGIEIINIINIILCHSP